ncbi:MULTISPECIES: J domain-containing protein [Brevibacillus]|uniref:J domain-containing protein n=1 Tax=Brevibacillus TaxID=55080 RepID=UPI001E35207C|nr:MULTISPECIES: DnaJ domain-containing protein [Brevibacillus]MCE0452471.1 J domain-containing protein [Brevibacillus sp. AF8]UKK99900.1 J domain-containing protein [Brevibacillus brevis]
MKNYYEILGLTKQASTNDIKKAYRQLAKQHHPDVNAGSSESERIFKEITEAYQTLQDPALREAYDARYEAFQQKKQQTGGHTSSTKQGQSKQQAQSAPGVNFEDLGSTFERFFGFHPKTGEINPNTMKSEKKNPLDTTDMFEQFFRMKKK